MAGPKLGVAELVGLGDSVDAITAAISVAPKITTVPFIPEIVSCPASLTLQGGPLHRKKIHIAHETRRVRAGYLRDRVRGVDRRLITIVVIIIIVVVIVVHVVGLDKGVRPNGRQVLVFEVVIALA